MKHTPTNEPVATGKHSIGLGAESVALSGIADYGHDPYRPSKHTPTKAENEAIMDAVLMPLERAFLTPTKQRLEALRDKWNSNVSDLLCTGQPLKGEVAKACGIQKCIEDLQKEIDLLP